MLPTQVQNLESSPTRQVKQSDGEVSVDFDTVAASKKCIDKIEMVEETEYDEEVTDDEDNNNGIMGRRFPDNFLFFRPHLDV